MKSPARRCPAARPSRAALRLAPIGLALLASSIAQAQNKQNRLDPVVVTASRSPQLLSQVLADTTVITREDIERQAFGGIADLLRSQACFEMVRNGNIGASTSLFVRGAETRHTMVLIDGVPYDSQRTDGASWQSLPLAQIERIEIVRGAASAVHGSDAIGGVVQIFTRKGEGAPQLELGIGGGNLGLAKFDASLSGMSGIFDYAVSAARERSTGFNSRPVTGTPDLRYQPDIDGYSSRSVSIRVGAQLNRQHRVELSGLNSHVEGQYDASARPTVDDRNLNAARALRGSWSAQWSPDFSTNVSIGESTDKYETQPNPYLTETRTRSTAFNGSYKLGGGQLNGALERREDKLENTSVLNGKADRHQDAVGLGYLWASGPLSLQVHGRHDRDSEFGSSNNGTIAAGYQLTPQWRLLSSYGTAFKAPSLYQRFSEYGKPDLKPEQGRNAEVGLHFTQGVHGASLTAYRNLIDDLIVFGAPGPCKGSSGCYENVGQARLQGLSLRGNTVLASVRLSGSLDLQSPKDVTERVGYKNYGRILARRSKTHGTLRAETDLAGWALGAQLWASGQRTDSFRTGARLGGYATMDLDAQYSINPELRLQLKLENAFDRKYETALGYANAPFQFFVGLRYTPKL
ncbi:TonB-dependent receptor [Roseateles sp. DAIF2]|uniref:TonB-dependent receptor domain-containing protein n=1 Tax=Roseateles sp. DAIF2 TaxID=2714952 RepID=UPI0018A337C9|nr:TonB-dependent receptor [Roseateles sp. DAIF2]QPF75432.1 TonB-dependent receptor [Roseateles sp. DAIF2]